MSERVGLFGGSFDPIHRGHVAPVRAAMTAFGLDRVLYLPTARPPHKPERRMAPPWSRFAMVELALLDEPGLEVSPLELLRDRPVYTVETLRQIGEAHPGWGLELLLGADSFRDLATWRDYEEILHRAGLIVLARPGVGDPARLLEGLPAAVRAAAERGRVRFSIAGAVDVSSTDLRERLRRGEAVPEDRIEGPVLQYIRKYDLYR